MTYCDRYGRALSIYSRQAADAYQEGVDLMQLLQTRTVRWRWLDAARTGSKPLQC